MMWGFTSLCFFPTLVALAIFKDAWVKDVWCSIEGGGSWSPHFFRPFNDWEMDDVHKCFLGLNG